MSEATQKTGLWATIKELLIILVIIFLIRTIFFGLYQVPSGSMETTMLVGERFFAWKLGYFFKPPKRGDIIAFNTPLYNYSSNPIKRLFQDYVWGPDNWTKRVIGQPGDTVRGTVEDGKPVVYVNGEKLSEPYINHYPLIRMWHIPPDEILYQLRQQARWSRLSPQEYDNRLRVFLQCNSSFRSYDPSYPYEKQPFYRINPQLIMKDEYGNPFVLKAGQPIEGTQVSTSTQVPTTAHWNGTDDFYVELGPDEYWVMGDNRLGSHDSRAFGPLKKRLIHGQILFRIWSSDSAESWWIIDLLKHPIDFWKRIRWNRFFQKIV